MEPENNQTGEFENKSVSSGDAILEDSVLDDEESTSESHKSVFKLVLIIMAALVVALALVLINNFINPDKTPSVPEETNTENIEEETIDMSGYGAKDGLNRAVLQHNIHVSVGEYYSVPESGKTLYTIHGTNTCDAGCSEKWTPYLADEFMFAIDKFGLWTAALEDGSFQYTLYTRPLYTYEDDVEVGNFLGDGYGDMFRIARPK